MTARLSSQISSLERRYEEKLTEFLKLDVDVAISSTEELPLDQAVARVLARWDGFPASKKVFRTVFEASGYRYVASREDWCYALKPSPGGNVIKVSLNFPQSCRGATSGSFWLVGSNEQRIHIPLGLGVLIGDNSGLFTGESAVRYILSCAKICRCLVRDIEKKGDKLFGHAPSSFFKTYLKGQRSRTKPGLPSPTPIRPELQSGVADIEIPPDERQEARKYIDTVIRDLGNDLDPDMRLRLKELRERTGDPKRHQFRAKDVKFTILTLYAVCKALSIDDAPPNPQMSVSLKASLEERFGEAGRIIYSFGGSLENFEETNHQYSIDELRRLRTRAARTHVEFMRSYIRTIDKLKIFDKLLGISLLGLKLLNAFRSALQKVQRIRGLDDVYINPDEACCFLSAMSTLIMKIGTQYQYLLRTGKIG